MVYLDFHGGVSRQQQLWFVGQEVLVLGGGDWTGGVTVGYFLVIPFNVFLKVVGLRLKGAHGQICQKGPPMQR
jgi:hypothetical protein